MAYCPKCGNKNEDSAEFCGKCGNNLKESKKDMEKECENRCDEDCAGGKRGPPVIWGIIVILFGLWILFEFVIKNTTLYETLPVWIQDFSFWWLIALVIAIAIILTGIRMLIKK